MEPRNVNESGGMVIMEKGLVSAIISLYDCDRFIESFLYRLSKQTIVNDVEFIFIINDDKSGDINSHVEKFGFRKQVINVPLENIYASWNRAIKVANGEFLCNLNCDDYHFYYSLEMCRKLLEENPEGSLCRGRCDHTNEKIKDFDSMNHEIDLDEVHAEQKNDRHCGPCPMWRSEVHNEVGLFNEKYKCAGDHDMWLRMLIGGFTAIETGYPSCVYYNREDTLSNRRGMDSAGEVGEILNRLKKHKEFF